MSERETAGGDLGLVQAFVNTLDVLPGKEELRNPDTLRSWLVANLLLGEDEPVDGSDLKHAIAVREAIRAVIGGNNGRQVYPVEVATLNEAASASGLRMRFGRDGKPRLEPEATGPVGAMGRLVATLYSAVQGERWDRLKLCTDDHCSGGLLSRPRTHPT